MVADITAKVLGHEAKAVLSQSYVLLSSIDEKANVAASEGVNERFAKGRMVQSNKLKDVVGNGEDRMELLECLIDYFGTNLGKYRQRMIIKQHSYRSDSAENSIQRIDKFYMCLSPKIITSSLFEIREVYVIEALLQRRLIADPA